MDTEIRPEVRRIAIVGPECTGKTELARFLANHYHTVWVPEFAREYLETLGRPYQKSDLITIAHGQLHSEHTIAQTANRFVFCDTTLIVVKIWSEFKYGSCDPEIVTLMGKQVYDLHLLTDIDLPWEDDPLREHPNKRQELFKLYEEELKRTKTNYRIIRGHSIARRQAAIEAVTQMH
jgi:NadR type nicotinamide-nucleotide adenylyltransferase